MEAQDYVLALKGLKLTQTQISEATGVPQPTISKIERGDVADVMSKNYRALQDFYERTVAKGAANELVPPQPQSAQPAIGKVAIHQRKDGTVTFGERDTDKAGA